MTGQMSRWGVGPSIMISAVAYAAIAWLAACSATEHEYLWRKPGKVGNDALQDSCLQ
jgi:hypothetical protein